MTKSDKRDLGKFAAIGVIALAVIVGGVMAVSFYLEPQDDIGADTNDLPAGPQPAFEELEERAPGELIPTAIAVDPQILSAGSRAMVIGDGFGPEEEVTITIGDRTIETTPRRVATDSTGQFEVEIAIPEEERGEHAIAAEDESGNTASMLITITAEQDPEQEPIPHEVPTAAISVSRVSEDEEKVTIAGDGFTPNEQVLIAVNDRELPTEEMIITDDAGIFSIEIILPEITEGEYIIAATDESSQSASTVYRE